MKCFTAAISAFTSFTTTRTCAVGGKEERGKGGTEKEGGGQNARRYRALSAFRPFGLHSGLQYPLWGLLRPKGRKGSFGLSSPHKGYAQA